MPCASYAELRLAAVYDALNPPGADYPFYVDVAGPVSRTVLDMGCGTGRLAHALAANGHRVTAADPAAAMLTIARRRPGGDRIKWIETEAATLDIDTRFDLAIMTGHVFQVFLGDDEVRAVLGALNRHRAPGGRLAFETRNPLVREWEDWVPERTRERVVVPDVGIVNVHYDIASVSDQLVTFETHFRFPGGGDAIGTSVLRFMPRDQLAGLLAEAGFDCVTWYGDWDRSPLRPESPEIIVIAS